MILNYIFTLLIPLLGGVLLLDNKISQKEFFSKDYTNVLKGICCLIVIYVHFPEAQQNALQDAVGSFAYVAVTFFFMVSSYGMMVSIERKKTYLDTFWRNRLIALLVPVFLVNVLKVVLGGIKGFFLSELWYINNYVMVLLEFCLLFYVVEKVKVKWFTDKVIFGDTLLIGGVILSSVYIYLFGDNVGWCFERIGLVWGILLYRYFNKCAEWMNRYRWGKVVILCVVCLIMGGAYLKFKTIFFWGEYILKIILGVVIIAFLFTITSNRKFVNKVSFLLGDISYEVYLSHGVIMGVLAYYMPNLQSGWFIILTVIFTLAISTLIHRIGKPIVKKLRK